MSIEANTSSSLLPNGKNDSSFRPSLGILALVIFCTGALYGYSFFLEKQSTEYGTKIEQLEKSIAEVKKDEKLQAFEMIERNKGFLNMLESRSKITSLLDHMTYIKGTYGVSLTDFNYADGEINTTIVSSSIAKKIGYKKLVDFISKYREDEKAIFSLNFVDNIKGHNKISSHVNFTLKKQKNHAKK